MSAEIEQLERQRADIDARLDQLYRQRTDNKQKARASQVVQHAKPAKTAIGNGKAHPKQQHNKPVKNGNVKPRKQEEPRVEPLSLTQKQELADKILVAHPDVQMQAMEVIRRSTVVNVSRAVQFLVMGDRD